MPSTSLRNLAALSVLVGALCRLADAAAPTCNPGFDWTFNSLGQSPCEVAAALGGVCNGGNFTLSVLTPSQRYAGPPAGFGTPCRCSTVYYSTLNACAYCQGAGITPWTYYNTNCTTVYTQIFPSPIPSGFSVPHWAYLDVTAANTFDYTLAQAAGGSDSSAIPQATSPAPSRTPSTSKNRSNAGAIAGGVVGGIAGLALIGGIVFWLLRRKKNAASQPTPAMYDPSPQPFTPGYEKSGMDGSAGVQSVSTPPPKLYNPNDPTTFPAHAAAQNYMGPVPTNTLSTPQQPTYPNHPNFPGNPQMTVGLIGPAGSHRYTGVPEL